MSLKILFQQIEAQITSQGFFIVRDALQLFHDHCTKWQKCIQQFMMTYHETQIEKFGLLCDFVIEKNQELLIGTASLSELSSGELQFGGSTIAFRQNQIKQKNLICIYSDKVPLQVVLHEIRRYKVKKNRKYKNKLSLTMIRNYVQAKKPVEEQQQKPRLPKKTLKKSKAEPMQIQVVEKAPRRQLMLRSSQSQSQQVLSKEKLQSQIAFFSMKNHQDKQQSQKLESHQQKIVAPNAKIKSQSVEHSLRERKLSKSDSLDIGKKTQNKKEVHEKRQGKKQSKKQQIEKQSTFMSNWIHKSK